jgi:hypothetical protein
LSSVYTVSLILIVDLFIVSLVFLVKLCVKLCWFATKLCWLALTSYCPNCRSQLIIYTFECRCWVKQYKPVFLYTFIYINKCVLKVIISLVYL